MKKIIITGATGMVGNIALNTCLKSEDIESVISIGRKSVGFTHPKLTEIIHSDFLDFKDIENAFENIDVAIYCLGVYTGAVDRATFKTINVDFTKAFADTLKKKSPHSTFCFLSGQGADSTEKSRIAFAKDKGMAENIILALNFSNTYIFRPAYIYPVTPRKEPNFSYRIFRKLYPLMKTIYPKGVIPSVTLGKAMVAAGLSGATKTILENEDIKGLNHSFL